MEIGSLYTPYGARDVEVAGGLAYITDRYDGGLRIIDVSDPTLPVEVGSFPAQCQVRDVEVVGNYAYLADMLFSPPAYFCGSALRVIDVSNPAAPTQVSESYLSWFVDIEAVEGVVYSALNDMESIDVSNPAAPVAVGVVPEVLSNDIDVADGYVYSAFYTTTDPSTGERYGLEVIDVMDPTNPFRVGRGVASGTLIDVVDGLAYLGGIGLQVADVSNPAAPTRRGSRSTLTSSRLAPWGSTAATRISKRA